MNLEERTSGTPCILHLYACGADGRSIGRAVYGHVITKFSRMGSLPHFLTHGASRARAPLQWWLC